MISEDLGHKLDKVELTQLGSCKKVRGSWGEAGKLRGSWGVGGLGMRCWGAACYAPGQVGGRAAGCARLG